MYLDYLFYLETLAKEEKLNQILSVIIIFTILLAIAGAIEIAKQENNCY